MSNLRSDGRAAVDENGRSMQTHRSLVSGRLWMLLIGAGVALLFPVTDAAAQATVDTHMPITAGGDNPCTGESFVGSGFIHVKIFESFVPNHHVSMEENVESFQDLHANLGEQGIDARTVPLVLQYNKQDLPRELILDTSELSDALNFRGVPEFSADALHGPGVFETLRSISELVLKRLSAGAER